MFGALLELLLAGHYAPGERLPPQRALAGELGVTMTTLREALKRLEQMGLIEVHQGEPMRVKDWRAHGGLDVLAHLLLRSGGADASVLSDILEARTFIVRELAGLAADRAGDADTARIRRVADALAQAEPDEATALDFAFFTELAEAAGNIVFVLVLNAIRAVYFEHAASIPVTARHHELVPAYRAVADAVAAHDVPAARAAAWELAVRQWERAEP